MQKFNTEEMNLISLYDPGNLSGLLYELRAMRDVLMPDETELRDLTNGVIHKLELMTQKDYSKLNSMMIPPFGAFHFDDTERCAINTHFETED